MGMAVLFRSMGCGGREVGVRRKLGRPDQLLLLLWQVAREARDAVGAQPDPPAVGLDVGEDVADRELVLLALRGLVLVRRERGDIDQPGDPVIGSRRGDHGSAVGVADQDGRAAHPAQRAAHGRDVTVERVEAVLAGNHLGPSACRAGITLLKHDPSAQTPWTKTMLGLACAMNLSLQTCRSRTHRNGRHPSAEIVRAADHHGIARTSHFLFDAGR
jgi:hypothetical protein